jgi:hypothetical protein
LPADSAELHYWRRPTRGAGAARNDRYIMFDITPAEIVPFIVALVCAFAAMLFGRHSEDPRPYSLVSAILYAVALGFLLLGLIAWGMRLLQ